MVAHLGDVLAYSAAPRPLGTLSIAGPSSSILIIQGCLERLPFEIRSQIYSYVLYFSREPSKEARRELPIVNRTALFLTSRAVYAESKKILLNVNHFKLLITQWPYYVDSNNLGPSGELGWYVEIQHATLGRSFNSAAKEAFLTRETFRELREVTVHGRGEAIKSLPSERTRLVEKDLAPVNPEWTSTCPGYRSVMMIVKLVTSLLSESVVLEELSLIFMFGAAVPMSLSDFLQPWQELRGVKKVTLDVAGVIDLEPTSTMMTAWSLSPEYKTYIEGVMQSTPGSKHKPFG